MRKGTTLQRHAATLSNGILTEKKVASFALLLLIAALPVAGQQNTATFVYPVDGQQSVDTAKPFQWTSPPGATRYQLYVGTALGASDLVNSAQIQATSYVVPALPVGMTLYARIWTYNGTTWLHQDITFTAAVMPAKFTYPVNGQQNVDVTKPFQWTSPPGATGYQLYVGTTSVMTRSIVPWWADAASNPACPFSASRIRYPFDSSVSRTSCRTDSSSSTSKMVSDPPSAVRETGAVPCASKASSTRGR